MRGDGRRPRSCLFLPALDALREVVWRPAADVYRTTSGWVAKFDLAGVRLEEVRVEVSGRQLRVAGIRRDCVIEEGCYHHSLEIAYTHFERHLEFPVNLERARLSTEYQGGMLLVRIWTEEERP